MVRRWGRRGLVQGKSLHRLCQIYDGPRAEGRVLSYYKEGWSGEPVLWNVFDRTVTPAGSIAPLVVLEFCCIVGRWRLECGRSKRSALLRSAP